MGEGSARFDRPRRSAPILCCLTVACAISLATTEARAQLVINEVLADNGDQGPADSGGGTPDLIELYNLGDEPIELSAPTPKDSYYLSDDPTAEFDPNASWRLPTGARIEAGGFLVIFADDDDENTCEIHADFKIDESGREPISIWGPEADDGSRELIDRVWLPPLRRNISFGRFPDGAGPAPVPVDETLDVFRFNPRDTSSFGTCTVAEPAETCAPGVLREECLGAENGPGGNLEPRISRDSISTNRPAADEAVIFVARIRDDKEPVPDNIVGAEIRYTIDGVEQEAVAFEFLEVRDRAGETPSRPLDIFSLWQAEIPAAGANAVVVYELYVEDAEGLFSISPRDLCPSGTGPCNQIGLPGDGCVEKPRVDMEPRTFFSCDVRGQYQSGYTASGGYEFLVLNEVVPTQGSLLRDTTEAGSCAPDDEGDVGTECHFDDFVEIYNGYSETLNLGGLWLSDRRVDPRRWQFPEGAAIASEEYLLVWLDGDGDLCPRPEEDVPGDGQKCPDPTNVALNEYHANFSLDGGGDQLYLLDTEENGFGVIHAIEFGIVAKDASLALVPNGCPTGEFRVLSKSQTSPRLPNPEDGECAPPIDVVTFLRGDANSDCSVNIADPVSVLGFLFSGAAQPVCLDALDANDTGSVNISDAVSVLNFLFSGGPPPSPPGHSVPGTDPTEDDLAPCLAPACKI